MLEKQLLWSVVDLSWKSSRSGRGLGDSGLVEDSRLRPPMEETTEHGLLLLWPRYLNNLGFAATASLEGN